MSIENDQPVLILGAGINGAAVARELLLNGVPVCLVDVGDIACGATARSSRLIHGGLRYLEHGDFALVRESLVERSRLRRLAPQFVSPLRLHIPVSRRTGGFIRSVRRFLKIDRWPGFRWLLPMQKQATPRGLWLIRLGLWIYDWFASDDNFERARVVSTTANGVPQVDAVTYPWQCVYADGQMLYPERFVVALLEDARQLAADAGVDFTLLTYHRADMQGDVVELSSIFNPDAPAQTIRPRLIINATGAWGDLTLKEMKQPSPRLIGGTKGSHFVTYHPQLKAAMGEGGLYAEADDGRLVFVLPFGEGVLIGTTDDRFDDRPERAVATSSELAYLIELVNDLFPQIQLTQEDIDFHYAGVRPLPYQPDGRVGSIPRGHAIEWNDRSTVPVLTLVGGKLTTCRALAEDVVAAAAEQLQIADVVTSRDRVIPGGDDYPTNGGELLEEQRQLAERFRLKMDVIQTVWSLCGSNTREAFDDTCGTEPELIVGTNLLVSFVERVIDQEWVSTLDDLVERRLMLLFQPDLSVETLQALVDCLVKSEKLQPEKVDEAVERVVHRLYDVYGKKLRRGIADNGAGDSGEKYRERPSKNQGPHL